MQAEDVYWWKAKNEGETGAKLLAAAKTAANDLSNSLDTWRESMFLYGDHNALDYEFNALRGRTRLTLNLVKSLVDQVVSRVTKNTPRPRFLTTEGNYSLKNKAKRLTHFVDWAMEAGKAKKVFQRAFRDASVMGTGFVHVFREGKEIMFERVLPSEILVDVFDGRYQTPRCIYRRKWIPRETLIHQYPKKEEALRNCSKAVLGHDILQHETSSVRVDLIEVIEGWRLPDQGKKNGRHVLATSSGVLVDEKYAYSSFPIIPIRYSERNTGFYGQGITDVVRAAQIDINKNLIKKQRILDQVAVPLIAFENKMGRPGKMNNGIGVVYTGRAPTILAPRTVPPELDNHIEMVWAKSHTLVGLSAGDAAASLPPGVTSGTAIQEYDALVDGMIAIPHQEFQDAWVEASKLVVRLGKEISKKHPKWTPVAASDKYTVFSVPWKELELPEDGYVIRTLPASALPTGSAGRLQRVTDMAQMGAITDPVEIRRLLDFPDLAEANALDRAASDYLDWAMEQMLDKGETIVPEPFQDHQLALKRAMAEYHRARTQGVPEARMDVLMSFIVSTRDEIKKAQAEQAQVMAPAAAGSPPATGFDGAPPTALQPGDSPLQ